MTTIQRPPAPPRHWLLGNIQDFQGDPLVYERHLVETYGDIVHLRFLNINAYMVQHPDHMHEVLVEKSRSFHKGLTYKNMLSRFLGNGLLTSDGDFWRRQRKLAQPAFHSKRIQTYADVMVDYTVDMLDQWQPNTQRTINLDMMRLTLMIVAKTLFNANIANDTDKVWEALTALLHLTDEALKSPLPIPEWIPTPRNRQMKAAVKMLDEVVLGLIEERRKSNEDAGDLLSMLMQAQDEDGSQMSDTQLRDEAVTIVLAGHETTANALTWAWYLLAQYPEIEAKLHEELDQVLGGRLPTFEDVRQLPYTEMIIKETMRLYPPIPHVERMAIEEVEVGGYTLPKGTVVLLSPHLTHRDARWYENPDSFIPERWTRDFEKALPKSAYIPFGGGARFCIGNSFAMMEATLIMATIASRYQLRMSEPKHIDAEAVLTLRPVEDIQMRIEPRQRVSDATPATHDPQLA